jgi:hypothetical protein
VAGSNWLVMSGDEIESKRRLLTLVRPIHVHELCPAAAAPFVRIESSTSENELSRYAMTVDTSAFKRAEPFAYRGWRVDHFVMPGAEEYVWTLDVDPEGNIVRWQDPVPGAVIEWFEVDQVRFESDLRGVGN